MTTAFIKFGAAAGELITSSQLFVFIRLLDCFYLFFPIFDFSVFRRHSFRCLVCVLSSLF